LRPNVPEGPHWVYEIKYDGYRVQAHLNRGEPTVTSEGHDWSKQFKPIALALAKLQAKYLIADGEVVVIDSHGVPDFSALHADLATGRTDRLLYYTFDLLYLDGFDLRASPLLQPKRVLSLLLDKVDRVTEMKSRSQVRQHQVPSEDQPYALCGDRPARTTFQSTRGYNPDASSLARRSHSRRSARIAAMPSPHLSR
jgi:bifunctional non-homologous end joining protein LigD